MNELSNYLKPSRIYGIPAKPIKFISINTNLYDLRATSNFESATLSCFIILPSSKPADLHAPPSSTTGGSDLSAFAKLPKILHSIDWRNWTKFL